MIKSFFFFFQIKIVCRRPFFSSLYFWAAAMPQGGVVNNTISDFSQSVSHHFVNYRRLQISHQNPPLVGAQIMNVHTQFLHLLHSNNVEFSLYLTT